MSIDHIELENGYFKYDDNRRLPLQNGMDYWHLEVNTINARINDLDMVDRNFKGTIVNISARERCGFVLKDLEGVAQVTSKGVRLKNVILETPESIIHASKFNLKSPSYYSFYSFVDSVAFDSKIDSSTVDFADIVHFAPQIDGMCGKIKLTTEISQKIPSLTFNNASISFAINSLGTLLSRSDSIAGFTIPDS